MIANAKTYDEIGITASFVIIICRALQGFTSMGEKVGAQLYLAETLKQPQKYVYSWFIHIQSELGATFALIVASLSIAFTFNWRIAFWIGATVAIIGFIARTRLRETPDFIDHKRRMKIKMEINKQNSVIIKDSPAYQEKIDKKAALAYFFIRFLGPACFYITYIYIGDFMKTSLALSAEEIINQNLKVSILTIIGMLVTVNLVRKYHPVKIAKGYVILFIGCLPLIPYCLNHVTSLLALGCLQFITFFPTLSMSGVEVACFKHFPVAKRFTVLATIFGVSAALSYTIASFSLTPLTKYFGYYALWFIYIPILIGFIFGVRYLEKLEKKQGRYDNYPKENDAKYPDTAIAEEGYQYDFDGKEEYTRYNLDCEYAKSFLNRLLNQMQQENKQINIKLIKKAIIFAKKWHDGQFRDTGEPFYSHPLAVADIVAEYYLKTDVIIAAILHDVIEDSDCTFELIEEEFGLRIAQLVDRLTKIRFENGEKIRLSLQETIERLYKVNDNEALLVKQIDRLHNLHTINGRSKERQVKAAVETSNYLITTVNSITDRLNITQPFSLENKLFKYCRDILVK